MVTDIVSHRKCSVSSEETDCSWGC